MYKRNGVTNFIGYNPNWDEIFSKLIKFIKKMSATLHGFYLICRVESNPNGLCRKYSFDFVRSVVAGEIEPKTVQKTHWFCLKRHKRIYNCFTRDDAGYFYPRNNVIVLHGVNEQGRRCPVNVGVPGLGCNGCNFKELAGNQFDWTCSLCEGDEKISPMYVPL